MTFHTKIWIFNAVIISAAIVGAIFILMAKPECEQGRPVFSNSPFSWGWFCSAGG